MSELLNPSRKPRRFPGLRLPLAVRRALPGLILLLAFVVPPLLIGGLNVARVVLADRIQEPAALSQPIPGRPPHDPSKRTAVVVAGNAGTESSDLMGPYETLATSGAFNVYVVAPERRPAPLFPGDAALVPHYSFAEYDATFSGPPDLVVVPYIPYAATKDTAVLDWIRQQADAGTTILSICAGAAVVADAGVLSGQTATTHHVTLPDVQRLHPEVTWVQGVRYVDSGQFISSAGVTSGVDATLYTLGRMFGRELAEQTAQAMGYPHLRFLDDPTWNVSGLNVIPFLPNAMRWQRDEIGLILYDGVRELEVSSVLDTYPRSFGAVVRTLARERTMIHTRHGLDLVPQSDLANAPKLDRLLVPGDASASQAVAAVAAWTQQHPTGPAVEPIHAGGAYFYDATIRDMARHESNGAATEAANTLEYPTNHLTLDGPASRLDLHLRALALGLLGLGAALWLRRRPIGLTLRVPATARSVGRFALHFGEMWLAMVAGMIVYHGFVGHAAATASPMHQIGMMVAMTVPMVGWMRVRGHGWRHGVEMSIGMLAPVVAIQALLALGFGETAPWLQHADGPAMLIGMLASMLLRREHYTGGHAHAATAAHPASAAA